MCVTSVYGVATMTIDDGPGGAATVVITDGDGDGVINFNGAVGIWNIVVNTGLSKPALGSATAPHMDLTYTAVSSAAGTLKITLTDDGFTYSGGLVDSWGGTTSSVGGPNSSQNNVLVNGQSVTGAGPFGNGSFSSTTLATVSLRPADTLSLVVALTHANAGNSSGDKDVHTVPDGGMTLMLLGSGFTALGIFGRSIRRKA